jgi:hypothetical protein
MPNRNNRSSRNPFDLPTMADMEVPLPRSTAGELFPDGSCLELILRPESDEMEFAFVRGQKTSVGTSFEVDGHTYAPAPIDSSFLRATVLPSGLKAYGSTNQLFTEIRDLFTQFGFLEDVCLLASYFLLATWFTELLPIAPCFVINGPRSEALLLLDLLGCLVRRPLHFGEPERAVLSCLPYVLQPTLLFSDYSTKPRVKNLLAISSRRGYQLARGSNVVAAFYAKAIYCGAALANDDFGGAAIRAHLEVIRGRFPLLNSQNKLRIIAEFQPKLLAYRAATHVAVSQSEFDLPELSSDVRILARTLGVCVVGSPEIQAGLKRLLGSYDAGIRAERRYDVRYVAIESLFSFCHTRIDEKIYVGEVTKTVDEIQKSRGEGGAHSARQMGDVLRSLGFHAKRDGNGFSILLTENMRRYIHELARDFEIKALQESEGPCDLCTEYLAALGVTSDDGAGTGDTNGE